MPGGGSHCAHCGGWQCHPPRAASDPLESDSDRNSTPRALSVYICECRVLEADGAGAFVVQIVNEAEVDKAVNIIVKSLSALDAK
eukprot:1910394-Pyramimonas_sp.AAC.2